MTQAPEQTRPAPGPGDQDDDDRGLEFNGRTVLTLCGFLFATILALYFLLPRLAGLEDTWNRIEDGNPAWIVLAFVFTIGMFAGYVELFRGVFHKVAKGVIGRRESYLITMAALAASRIFAAGGAGGLVLQAWALRQAGLAKRVVADKTIAFLVLNYFPYAAAVIVAGFGLYFGIFPGEAPFTMTVVPAVIAIILMAADEPDRARSDRPHPAPRRLGAAHGHDRPHRAEARRRPRRQLGRHPRRDRPRPRAGTPRCSAPRCSGASRSPCCGPRSAHSASHRRSRCSFRRSSSACSGTCCRSRVASAGSRVG